VSVNSTSLALVVLAAGAGRRYQGLKQLAPVGPGGESIMEYSIFDALSAGFDRIVLVIRREHEEMFREKFVLRIRDRVAIEFAYQGSPLTPLPGAAVPPRQKPWGTAHAVLCARSCIRTPFAVINADDFYGPSAIAKMAGHLKTVAADLHCGALVGYRLRNTLSDVGSVSRGLCRLDREGFLESIVECHAIHRSGDGGEYADDQGRPHRLGGDELVSMNLWGFPPTLFDRWEQYFQEFVTQSAASGREFEIPGTIQKMIAAGDFRVRVLESDAQWFGLTYSEERVAVESRIAALTENGKYPTPLWT
jgi:dTDP-glucose pyrophosphorylase